MATKKKLLQAAAGSAGGAALNVEDVFSTYVYDGSSSAQTITNGIDLSGEGGMVWIKERSTSGSDHGVHDTERGVKNPIFTNLTDAENSYYNTNNLGITAFNSNGFTVASGSNFNDSGDTAVSWTFRKAPKFFTIVNYTGDGTTNRQISHDLGGTVGHITVKRTDTSAEWFNWHRTFSDNQLVAFTGTYAVGTYSNYLVTADSTTFTVGNNVDVNANGGTYVAYLWGHNDGDGEFGPDGDQDIIKCGSFTTDANGDASIDLGFEPQWVLLKRTDAAQSWWLADTMRGMTVGTAGTAYLVPDQNYAEDSTYTNYINPTATGFGVDAFSGSANYIYIAIRRGPMAVPESATDVFDVGDASETGSTAPEYEGGFTVDMALKRIQSASQSNYVFDRLRGGQSLITNGTSAESAFGAAKFDYMDGYYNGTSTSSANWSAMWRRAPNYFDVVAYTGNGTAGRNISHNLGVAPEMLWVKRRNSVSNWSVYHSGVGNTKYLVLNTTNAAATFNYWNNTDPTATTFGVSSSGAVNASGDTYIAYLFATLAGVSKVGSYTGSASAQTIDCGFTAGAKFVLIKRTDGAGSWVVWDTNRGIVAGNDPYFKLETNAAPETADDIIDPHNSGFTLAGGVGFANTSGGSYIFYAVA